MHALVGADRDRPLDARKRAGLVSPMQTNGNREVLVPVGPKQLRPHQERALKEVRDGLAFGTQEEPLVFLKGEGTVIGLDHMVVGKRLAERVTGYAADVVVVPSTSSMRPDTFRARRRTRRTGVERRLCAWLRKAANAAASTASTRIVSAAAK